MLLVVLFFAMCKNLWIKYQLRLTTFSVEEKRMNKIKYPSVTVCPSLPFKTLSGIFQNLSNIEDLRKKHKNKNDTFYFVNQQTRNNPGHPCMTTRDSINPGKPCMFPFKYENLKCVTKIYVPYKSNRAFLI